MDDEQQHLNATEARGGTTPGVTRYVLSISLMLIVVLFVGLLLLWR